MKTTQLTVVVYQYIDNTTKEVSTIQCLVDEENANTMKKLKTLFIKKVKVNAGLSFDEDKKTWTFNTSSPKLFNHGKRFSAKLMIEDEGQIKTVADISKLPVGTWFFVNSNEKQVKTFTKKVLAFADLLFE